MVTYLVALGAPQAAPVDYWLIQAEASPATEVREFIDWIRAEAQAVGC